MITASRRVASHNCMDPLTLYLIGVNSMVSVRKRTYFPFCRVGRRFKQSNLKWIRKIPWIMVPYNFNPLY